LAVLQRPVNVGTFEKLYKVLVRRKKLKLTGQKRKKKKKSKKIKNKRKRKEKTLLASCCYCFFKQQ
jgi:hypothetical protein